MAISDFTPETFTLPLAGGNSITLRGLQLDDVGQVLNEYGPEARQIVELLSRDPVTSLERDQVADIALTCGPEVVALVIALAADEPQCVDVARKLPAPVSLLCLAHIIRLSISDAAGADLADMARGFAAQVKGTIAKYTAHHARSAS